MQNDTQSILLALNHEMSDGKASFIQLSQPLQEAINSDQVLSRIAQNKGLSELKDFLAALSSCG